MDSYDEAIFNTQEPEVETSISRKNCTPKRPDKTPMTDKRKLALKKGEYLRNYLMIVGQLKRLEYLGSVIKQLDGNIRHIPCSVLLRDDREYMLDNEDSVRATLGQISKEESRRRANVRADRKYIKYLQKKYGKKNVIV